MARPIPRDAPVTIAVFLMVVLLLAASSNLKSVAKKRLNLASLYVQCIVLISIMRVTQLRQADLNLLVVFLCTCRRTQRIPCRQTVAAGASVRGEPRPAADARYVS